jgi:hypothetical protein
MGRLPQKPLKRLKYCSKAAYTPLKRGVNRTCVTLHSWPTFRRENTASRFTTKLGHLLSLTPTFRWVLVIGFQPNRFNGFSFACASTIA